MHTPHEWHQRFLHQASWTADLRRYLFKSAGMGSAQRVLEVGCGTGAVLGEVYSLPPSVSQNRSGELAVHGVDMSCEYLTLASQHAPGACLVQGDAHRLPYAEASFDLVFCHFLLLWVSDPAAALGEMRRVARPGGSVLALAEPDYGGRIDYPEALEQAGRLQEEGLRRQGAETRLGRRLGALFQEAGLSEVQAGVLGGEWRMQPSTGWESEWAVLESDLHGRVDTAALRRLRQLEAGSRQRGERLLFVPTFWAVGKKADMTGLKDL